VFLVSLKAGGTGLNLTAAHYVFLLDPWWNPAVEAQAVDRAHRIGQRRPVFAYRLIARDTVEEKILSCSSRSGASPTRSSRPTPRRCGADGGGGGSPAELTCARARTRCSPSAPSSLTGRVTARGGSQGVRPSEGGVIGG
jgi:hypothetical protein